MKPLIAIPHWRAPTAERTKYYYDALNAAGAENATVDEPKLPAGARGLLLTGGVDVDPRLYGEKVGPHTDKPSVERDSHELSLLREALERDLPVLCVCRGHELLNVALGGTLLQNIEGDGHRWHDDFSSRWHEVSIENRDSRLASVYGPGAALHVNSRHHQGVTEDRLAPQLQAVATSADGLVEAMESSGHRWVMGIQWHPERPEVADSARSLWEAFVAACGR